MSHRYYKQKNRSPFFSLQFDLTKQEPAPPAPTIGSGILEDGGDFEPPKSPPSRDFLQDYVVTVIVPLILAIILCLLLAYIMFGRREGVYASILTLPIKTYIYSVVVIKGQLITPCGTLSSRANKWIPFDIYTFLLCV